jgi:hypothetical protein
VSFVRFRAPLQIDLVQFSKIKINRNHVEKNYVLTALTESGLFSQEKILLLFRLYKK